MSKLYFEKLNTEKLAKLKEVKLAKLQEIKLSLIDEAKTVFGQSAKVLAEMESTIPQAEQLAERFKDVQKDSTEMFKRIDTLIDDESEAYDEIELMKEQLEKSAEAIGLDASDIKEYKDLDSLLDDISDRSSKLEDMFQLFQAIFNAKI
tara:strand:+ start:1270 stop:1716 length:447 start_codon:yes stop_codon:yes gene_type:complete